ncbi:hypothetical protein [Larkinella sp.]|uniref:hypothetical protein n=1 Tax=Larkinella sp. TaxID=2034517 RepID=UPI003BABCB14
MDHKKDEETRFPPEYSHVEDKVRQAKEQIDRMQEQAKTVPKDAGPTLAYNTPGFLRSRQPGSHDQRIASLNKGIENLRKEVLDQVEKDIRQADPKTARTVREAALESFYPNPVKEMTAEQRADFRKAPKDIEQSQEYMDFVTKKSAQEKNKPENDKGPRQQDLSLTQRFMGKFHHNKTDITAKPPTKDNRTLDKDRD